jgi:hypothetical protein
MSDRSKDHRAECEVCGNDMERILYRSDMEFSRMSEILRKFGGIRRRQHIKRTTAREMPRDRRHLLL